MDLSHGQQDLLNPLDYFLWGYLKEFISSKSYRNIGRIREITSLCCRKYYGNASTDSTKSHSQNKCLYVNGRIVLRKSDIN